MWRKTPVNYAQHSNDGPSLSMAAAGRTASGYDLVGRAIARLPGRGAGPPGTA